MKSLYSILFLAAAAFLHPGCTRKIDIKPDYQLDGSKPLSSIKEADNVLTGAYDGFQAGGIYNGAGSGNFSLGPDIMGDDLIESKESLGNYRRLAEWTYTSDDADLRAAWLNSYSIVSQVNIILRDIDAVAVKEPKAGNRIKGQALAIRAHVHFDLLRGFGESLDRNSTAKGVPYITKFDVTAKPGRLTVKESYDSILSDLNKAATLLSGELDQPINADDNRSRIDWLVVKAMQARVNLYASQWQAAADAATAVIDARPLTGIADFPGIWNDDVAGEVLWAVSFDTKQDGVPYDNVFFASGNRNTFKPAQALVNMYDQTNDVRYNAYIASVGDLNGIARAPRNIVVKHIGKGSAADGVVNWKAYRVGEMYLIRAEANYKLNKEAEALDDLNTLRRTRIDGFTNGTETGNALWTAIVTERRKELAFEGHRFFDLKRWNKTAINRCPSNTDTPSTICQLASDNRAWAWPIPFTETNVNKNLLQNKDY